MHASSVLADLEWRVRAATPPTGMKTKIIAVDGPGGAGKSSLAKALSARLDDAAVVSTDDFASWDVPLDWWPKLLAEVLEPLSRGVVARYRRSSWGNPEPPGEVEVAAAEFVILEGVSTSLDAFRPFLTYTIWVETPRSLRLQRGLARDGEAARSQWEQWMSEEDEYVRRERPHERADVVVRGDAGPWR